MPPPIQTLTERMAAARGLDYYTALNALDGELDSIDDMAFLEQISRVDNPDIFRHLFSMGLSAKRQQIVTQRWRELTE